MDEPGCAEKTTWVLVPATEKRFDVTVVNAIFAAVNVKTPWVPSVILHPAKVATPATAVTGLVVHVSVPVPLPIARVIAETLLVTTSPLESSILMTGCTVRFDPPVEFVGCDVMISCVAVPATAKEAVVAAESPLAVTDKVKAP